MKTLFSLAAVFSILSTSQTVAQEVCNPTNFRYNGLYYSADGNPSSTQRLVLRSSPGVNQNSIIALTGATALHYSPSGRFFLRSGAQSAPWLNLNIVTDGEAILVRRQTHSFDDLEPSFISIFRDHLPLDMCPKNNRGSFSDERNFVRQGEFIRYHQQSNGNRSQADIRENFHFAFRDGNVSCSRTDAVRKIDGVDATPEVFNGDIFDIRPRGVVAIERSAMEIASVIFPKPAYADEAAERFVENENVQFGVTSAEATLYYLQPKSELCISWPAPIPTVNAGGVLADLFDLRDRHRDAAARLYSAGKWTPQFSQVFIYKISARTPAGIIRLYWNH